MVERLLLPGQIRAASAEASGAKLREKSLDGVWKRRTDGGLSRSFRFDAVAGLRLGWGRLCIVSTFSWPAAFRSKWMLRNGL
jgi:hypothetical protein